LLITSTILISFFAAMVLFGAIMHTIGPQGSCGDLLWLCRNKNKSKDEIDDEHDNVLRKSGSDTTAISTNFSPSE